MRLVQVLLGLPLVATIGIALIQGSRHLAWDWPAHAHHHLIAHISGVCGLALLSLILVFGPLQRRERWAWWCLVLSGLCIYGGYWLGNFLVGLGEPSAPPNTSQAIQSALYVVGLIFAWRALAPGGSAHTT